MSNCKCNGRGYFTKSRKQSYGFGYVRVPCNCTIADLVEILTQQEGTPHLSLPLGKIDRNYEVWTPNAINQVRESLVNLPITVDFGEEGV